MKKVFIRNHYKDTKNKNYHITYKNYLYPKTKNVNDFTNGYKNIYDIEYEIYKKYDTMIINLN